MIEKCDDRILLLQSNCFDDRASRYRQGGFLVVNHHGVFAVTSQSRSGELRMQKLKLIMIMIIIMEICIVR